MTNLVLILPIIFCIILFILKNKVLNNILIIFYGVIHLLLNIVYFIKPEILFNNQYFSLNSSNIVFYMILSVVFLMVAIYNYRYSMNMEFDNKKMTRYSLMVLAFVLSMTGGILAQNLGLAWIFIEGTTLASAYLIYFNKTKHSIEAAFKYVFICSIGIALAFVGIILLTIATGNMNSLNYSDLYENARNFNHFWLNISFIFILVGMGTKMGLAPLHFWLPDAHSEAPSPISALLSATLLNCAFLVILNTYKIMIYANQEIFSKMVLIVMAFLSLFVGAIFMFHVTNYKRLLAYSSIENMGVIVLGLALGGGAYYALILHLIGHSLIKASYFLTSGNILELFETKKIKSIRQLSKVDNKSSWLFIFSFLGICAFPPSILFISEFLIAKEMVKQEKYILLILFLFLLTVILYAMGKTIFNMVYKKYSDEEISKTRIEKAKNNLKKLNNLMYYPQMILLIIAFTLGIYMPKFLDEIIRHLISM